MNSISLFNVALKGDTNPFLQKEVAIAAAKCGYVVAPEACTKETLEYFKDLKADFNSTFYKTIEDVTSKSRLELFIDQIMHYASTYGTGFSEGNGYVPNDGEHPEFTFTDYKYIGAISEYELAERCHELGTSGIALSSEVVEFCADAMIAWWKNNYSTEEWQDLIESLTNRELQATLYFKLRIAPVEKFALLRYIATMQLGNAMIIQNKEQIQEIKNAYAKFDFTSLTEKQVINLSSIFLRYKNWLLAFKDKKNAPVLNKMRRLAKKTHTPLKPGFWENILKDMPSLDIVADKLNEISNFKKICLYMACKERLLHAPHRSFLIRNQKFFYKENDVLPDQQYYNDLMLLILTSFPHTKVRLPKNIRLACPSSEKSFLGNMPLGTQYKFQDNGFLGIYWRNEWGTRDFDLHYFDTRGQHIGWNSAFYNGGSYYPGGSTVIYSGDMTNADPEATEIMFFRDKCPEGFISCARFSGNQGSRFDVIMGQEPFHKETLNRYSRGGGYMVDPNNIVARFECISDKKETTCGYVKDNTFTLMSFKTGNKQVPNNPELVKILATKAQSFLYLDEIFEVVPDDYEGEDFVDLSGELAKDDVIKLFA